MIDGYAFLIHLINELKLRTSVTILLRFEDIEGWKKPSIKFFDTSKNKWKYVVISQNHFEEIKEYEWCCSIIISLR